MSKKSDIKEMNRVELAKKLHKALDIMLAGFIKYKNRPVSELQIHELMDWSYQQTFFRNDSKEEEQGDE